MYKRKSTFYSLWHEQINVAVWHFVVVLLFFLSACLLVQFYLIKLRGNDPEKKPKARTKNINIDSNVQSYLRDTDDKAKT